MILVHLATEFAPIAKVGGLGDVVAGLARALKGAKQQVKVILPFYDQIDRSQLHHLKLRFKWNENHFYSCEYNGVSLILIAIRAKKTHLNWKEIYSGEDDFFKFSRFSQMALEYLLKSERRVDILHLHDWPTALAAPLYYEHYQFLGLKIGKVVLTLHNMQHQGIWDIEKMKSSPLPKKLLLKNSKLQDPTKPTSLNLLKGGILYSDSLTTVSPTYAEEIRKKEGFRLQPILEARKDHLSGILNGIDDAYWNPETDPFLTKNYPPNAHLLDEVKRGKRENRKGLYALCKEKSGKDFGGKNGPLFTSISRLTSQKGPKWIEQGLEFVLKKGGEFILLGSSIEPDLKSAFDSLAQKYQKDPRVFFHFSFDERLAHLTYAAADCILIPSLFEPCGLTQMIGLRYGTLPIVHRVGGLRDTVFDIDDSKVPLNKANGYAFEILSLKALQTCLNRVFFDYHHNKSKWERMQKNGLTKDWSWTFSAQKYLDLYREINASTPV